jgi:hypothetical protein
MSANSSVKADKAEKRCSKKGTETVGTRAASTAGSEPEWGAGACLHSPCCWCLRSLSHYCSSCFDLEASMMRGLLWMCLNAEGQGGHPRGSAQGMKFKEEPRHFRPN